MQKPDLTISLSLSLSLSLCLSFSPLSSLPLECMVKHLFMILATHSVTGNNLVTSLVSLEDSGGQNVPRLAHANMIEFLSIFVSTHTSIGLISPFCDIHRIRISTFLLSARYIYIYILFIYLFIYFNLKFKCRFHGKMSYFCIFNPTRVLLVFLDICHLFISQISVDPNI